MSGRSSIKTIPNARPHLSTVVEHILELPELCPVTRNPASGSTLTLRYVAGERLLELFSLEAYIDTFVGHAVVRDLEFLCRRPLRTRRTRWGPRSRRWPRCA